jgi:hypothetical protein
MVSKTLILTAVYRITRKILGRYSLQVRIAACIRKQLLESQVWQDKEFGQTLKIIKERRMGCQVRAKVNKITDTVAHSSRLNGAKSKPPSTAHEWKEFWG